MMRNHQTILLLRPGVNIALASTLGAQERKHAGQQTIGTCKHIPYLYSERICAESTVERRDMALCARPSGIAAVDQEHSVKFAFSVVSRKIWMPSKCRVAYELQHELTGSIEVDHAARMNT